MASSGNVRSGSAIREQFLAFFEGKMHRRVHSSSLVPANDPTLLFTNAGMNQFKDVFLGAERRDYSRAATSQKCVRAGGKHNDLENVGFTRRHHTFFEMLGNFSFGDYFKKDAIAYAWELLTKVWGIDPAKLYVTIFEGDAQVPRDDEAERFWIEVGVPKERIFGLGAKDNFWQMGETGPCGPCSEIYYDFGMAAADDPNVDKPFPQDEARYVEIWNLVFMQFDRFVSDYTCPKHSDIHIGTPGTCNYYESVDHCCGLSLVPNRYGLAPLPKPSIDTGMGLERIACVLQDRLSNYQTDLFTPLIGHAAKLTGFDILSATAKAKTIHTEPTAGKFDVIDELAAGDEQGAASLRIIADHARCATFLISDRVLPSNEGRGYVLRKIMRRAIRHGRLLGHDKPFLYKMVPAVCDLMGDAYPELRESAADVAKVVLGEEEQFARVLETGYGEYLGTLAVQFMDVAKAVTTISEQIGPRVEELVGGIEKVVRAAEPWVEGWYAAMQRLARVTEPYEKVFSTLAATPSPNTSIRNKLAHEGVPTQVVVTTVSGALQDVLHESERAEARLTASQELGKSQLLKQVAEKVEAAKFSGREAFRLYETYGLPLDFMVDAARDAGIAFDMEGFEKARQEEQARARASWKGGSQKTAAPVYRELAKTEFEGYGALRVDGAKVLALVKDGVGVAELKPGEAGEAVLDATSFYADSGGQVGDVGWLYSGDHNAVMADVSGASKPVQGVWAHRVVARERIAVGDTVDTVVDGEVRAATARNHTGTHLLHAALREVLGRHVKQAGSLVDRTRLRFDFSHFAGVAEEELREIEDIVNRQVLADTKVQTIVDVPIDVAVNEYHAMALFGEKYGDVVRVVKIGDFSTELCGGTHTAATGEIGLIKLVGEGSVSSGVRRVEAVSGLGALGEFRRDYDVARIVGQLVGSAEAPADALRAKIAAQEEEMKKLRRELDAMRMKSASAAAGDAKTVEVKGIQLLVQRVDGLERGPMRDLVDQMRGKLGSGVVVLGAASEGKVSLIVGVTKDLTGKIQAGKIVGQLAAMVGGKGGGRPDLAEAGGSDAGALDGALAKAAEIVAAAIS